MTQSRVEEGDETSPREEKEVTDKAPPPTHTHTSTYPRPPHPNLEREEVAKVRKVKVVEVEQGSIWWKTNCRVKLL